MPPYPIGGYMTNSAVDGPKTSTTVAAATSSSSQVPAAPLTTRVLRRTSKFEALKVFNKNF